MYILILSFYFDNNNNYNIMYIFNEIQLFYNNIYLKINVV